MTEDPVRGDVPADDIDTAFVPVRTTDVSWVELDGESVLYDGAHETLHLLDPIGTTVWECFDGEADIATLSEELAAAYGADAEVVGRDVLALTRTLGRRGLVAGIAAVPEEIEALIVQNTPEEEPSDVDD